MGARGTLTIADGPQLGLPWSRGELPQFRIELEPMLGGLQAGEVWLVDVKTLILDMGS
jgi:hypothetical protein